MGSAIEVVAQKQNKSLRGNNATPEEITVAEYSQGDK